MYGEKIVKVMDFAMATGRPIVGINEGGGARIQEGVVSLGLYAEIFKRNVHASGVVPQISLIMGAAAGGHVYSPALTDFVVMVDKTSQMFITGPDVVKAVTGEEVSLEELGGARTHNERSGNAHYLAADEDDAIDYVRELLSFLPSNNLSMTPPDGGPTDIAVTEADLALDTVIPDSPNQPYDMMTVIATVLDDDHFLPVQDLYAPNMITGFGRVGGTSVGIVANQPRHLAGTLDIKASEKAARFVRTCDAFNVPVLTFVDVPGFLPGTDQEWDGIIRRGAKLIYAYAEATVPLITVITRKAYGGAYDVMGSKHLGADVNLAWPTAQIAVVGAAGAVNICTAGISRRRRRAVRTSRPSAGRCRPSTRMRWSTPTLPPNAVTSTPFSRRGIPGRRSPARWRCCATSDAPCRRASTGTFRYDRGTDPPANSQDNHRQNGSAGPGRRGGAGDPDRPGCQPVQRRDNCCTAVGLGTSVQCLRARGGRLVGVRTTEMTGDPATAPLTTVLASASPARLAVLRAAGIDPVVFVSGVDERAVEAAHTGAGPAAVVTALARAKAEAVLPAVTAAHPDAVVIGCDSMLLRGGRLRGKPVDPAQVRQEWAEMAGDTGDLLTGHAVVVLRGGRVAARAADHRSTTIRFGSPSPTEIDAYLATGEPLLVAGGLTIDGYGGWFVEGLGRRPVQRHRHLAAADPAAAGRGRHRRRRLVAASHTSPAEPEPGRHLTCTQCSCQPRRDRRPRRPRLP